MKCPEKANPESQSRLVVCRSYGQGLGVEWEMTANRHKVCLGLINILKLDTGAGCTTLNISEATKLHTLKGGIL